MLHGNFYDKLGIYEFKGRHFTPIWMANSLREGNIETLYNLCIEGYDSSHADMPNLPKTVLVTCNVAGAMRWDEIVEHYPGLYAQSKLHYYRYGVEGDIPLWAMPWAQENNLLIHEYEGGKVVWMGDENIFDNDIYKYMIDCGPPVEQPGEPASTTPAVIIPVTQPINFPKKWVSKFPPLFGILGGEVITEAVEE